MSMLETLDSGADKKTNGSERAVAKSDLYKVVEDLRTEALEDGAPSIARSPRAYILERTISPRALEAMATLRIENSLYDHEGLLYFQTGQYGSTFPDYTGAEYAARFTLHNHPASDPGFTVSANDYDSTITSSSEIDFILTRDGIIGYKADKDAKPLKRNLMEMIRWAFQNPNRTLRQQKEAGISRFFVPFRGDADSQRRLEMICGYMNDPTIKWDSIKDEIETE
jgi:hypothetical protein